MTFEHTRHYFLERWAIPQTAGDNAALTIYDRQIKIMMPKSGPKPLLEVINAINCH